MQTGATGDHERRALPTGTRVQEFEILGLVGGGGFGIVYLAHDHTLERRVALKEYMPPLAIRADGSTQVVVTSPRDAVTFGTGLRSFVNEARLLARFDHAALVKVHRFWEENGTAYMVMPFYEGPTLQRAVAERRVTTDEASLRMVIFPLLDALSALHRERCYHRDISPDNILLTATGPVLLDFGAARMAIGDASQSFTVILKEGYAPVEQYAAENATAMRQGPWTDIYALSGVLRYVITGKKPSSAVARMADRVDPLEPLTRTAAGRYSDAFLRAIDAGMALYVEERPQSIAQFRALLSSPPVELDGVTLQRQTTLPDDLPPLEIGDIGAEHEATAVLDEDPLRLPSITAKPAATPAGLHGRPRPPASGLPFVAWAGIGAGVALAAAGLAVYLLVPLKGTALGALMARHSFMERSAEQNRPVSTRTERHSSHSVHRPEHPAEHAEEHSAQDSADAHSASSKALPAELTAARSAPPEPDAPPPQDKPSTQAATLASADTAPEFPLPAHPEEASSGAASAASTEPPVHTPALGQRTSINPALLMMLKAARGRIWEALAMRAMRIAQISESVPVGDRAAARAANDQGLAALREHRYADAVTAFESGARLDPSNIEVATNHGYALMAAGRRAEAQKVLTGVLLRDPHRSVAWTALAEARSDDPADALAMLEIALHFAGSRQHTLAGFREMARNHADPRMRTLASALLEEQERVPTVPEGLP